MKKVTGLIRTGILALGLSTTTQASLFDQGGGLIYDDVLDVTWLQDASFVQTSGHDADGAMNWQDSLDWVANLSYYDSVRDANWNDWRLPVWADTGSEMQSLWSDTLGNLSSLTNTGPFLNIQIGHYWAGTSRGGDDPNGSAWGFLTTYGADNWAPKEETYYAWAVRDGNVVPVPAAVWLFGSGLLGLITVARRKA